MSTQEDKNQELDEFTSFANLYFTSYELEKLHQNFPIIRQWSAAMLSNLGNEIKDVCLSLSHLIPRLSL